MRLKYYLRGAGVGVIVTTLIFTIALAFANPSDQEKTNQRDEVTAQVDENKEDKNTAYKQKVEEKEKTNQQDKKETTEEKDSSDENKSASTEKKYVEFKISGGESSGVIASHLQEAGLIDDAQAYDKFLGQNDYDNRLQPGTFQIPEGSSYKEIAEVLTTRLATKK